MEILLWVLFGALAGWIASLIAGTDEEQGAFGNVVVGILGALVGGFIVRSLGGAGVTGFNLTSLLIAVAGAILLLFAYRVLAHH